MDPSGSQQGEVRKYRSRLLEAIGKIDEEEIVALASELLDARRRGASVFLMGNGGSASTVNHYAVDWMLGTEIEDPPLKVLSLAESTASISATGNDLSFDSVFSRQLERLAQAGDLVVLVSASGNSRNLIEAVISARKKQLRTLAVTGFDGGSLRELVDVSIHTPTEIGDYGVAEDLHLSVGHVVKELLILAVHGAT